MPNCPPDESVFTLEDLAALKRLLITGEKRIKHADKEVEYRSTNEILEAIRLMEATIYPCLAEGTGTGGSRRYAITSKGLC